MTLVVVVVHLSLLLCQSLLHFFANRCGSTLSHFLVSVAANASNMVYGMPYYYSLSVSPLPSFVMYLYFIYYLSSNFVVVVVVDVDDDGDDIVSC